MPKNYLHARDASVSRRQVAKGPPPRVAVGALLVIVGVVAVVVVNLFRPGAVDKIVDASARTVAAGTARMAVTTVVDAGVGESKQRIDATGLVEFSRQALDLEMRMGLPQRTAADISSVGGMDMLVRSDGETTVTRLPSWPDSQPWAQLPDAEEGAALGNSNLGAQIELLSRGITDIEDVGTEIVRDDTTTHYRAIVDLEKALKDAPQEQQDSLTGLLDQAGRSLRVEVWVGEEYIRRISYTIDVPSAQPATEPTAGVPSGDPSVESPGEPVAPEANPTSPASRGGTVTQVTEYYDFGVPFTVAMPTDVVQVDEGGAPTPTPAPTPAPSTP